MPALNDIAVLSSAGWPALIVECKGGNEVSAEGAARFRRNLLAHELVPDVPFYMLAYPNYLYLWKRESAPDSLPDFQAPSASILKDYAPRLSTHPSNVQGSSLELVMLSWLSDLAAGIRGPNPTFAAEQMLLDSGLYKIIRDGKVTSRLAL
jgi:hypothetical protein